MKPVSRIDRHIRYVMNAGSLRLFGDLILPKGRLGNLCLNRVDIDSQDQLREASKCQIGCRSY